VHKIARKVIQFSELVLTSVQQMQRYVRVLAYLGSLCLKFHAAERTCWFFASFYLEPLSGLMRFRDESDSECASNFVEISEKVQQRPSQWLDKRSGKDAWAKHWKSKLTETDKASRAKSRMTHHFLWQCRGLFKKNSSCQNKRSIPHTTDVLRWLH
jgi:hypothetical protein